MASGTPGGNWKNTGANRPPAGGGGGGGGGKSRRPWQPGAAAKKPTGGRKKSRLGRLILAGVGVGLLVALIVLVLPWLRPAKYPVLVVVGPNPDGTSLAVPENAAGAAAADGLAEWARGEEKDKRMRLAAAPRDTADRDAWQARLDDKAPALFLYFAAPGGADDKGPFLWFVPAAAAAPADDHKLYVKDVLARLDGLPKDQKKLVVFDAARNGPSWAHGTLSNDFARGLKDLDGEVARVSHLVVIASADADERAWAADELGGSVFAHYLREGLRGAAKEKPGGGTEADGSPISAAMLFHYLGKTVPKWAAVNREERQTPILLPAADGRQRAEAITVAVIPTTGYASPKAELPGWKMPPELQRAWERVDQLATKQVPAPDTWDPTRWRRLLDVTARWERLERQGAKADALRTEADLLARDLEAAGGRPEECLTAAIPAGRALGVRPAATPADVEKVWRPLKGSRADAWADLHLGADRDVLAARRVAAGELAVGKVVADGPARPIVPGDPTTTLEAADDLLGAADGDQPGTAEGHFVRVLRRRLDPRRPDDAVLVQAVAVRRKAEEVAWVGGIEPGRHPHAEQVWRWVRGRVEAADAVRRPAEDLLFGTDPARWADAAARLKQADAEYDLAQKDARRVAAALDARDRVLARLPYYARWLAEYRSDATKLPAAEVEKLVARAEAAARAAHKITELTKDVPPPARVADRLGELAAATKAADDEFAAAVAAFDAEVNALALGNAATPTTWHALDNALTVPFIPAERRAVLLKHVREVANKLAAPDQTAAGRAPPEPQAQAFARRHGRLAVAVLGDPALAAAVRFDSPADVRKAGDAVGKRFREKAAEAHQKAQAVNNPGVRFRDAGGPLAEAAAAARAADPAAAVPTPDDPVVADRRFRQHDLLLWQARRTIADGWAMPTSEGPTERWYCVPAAALTVKAAAARTGVTADTPPAEQDRRLADVREVEGLQPVRLTVSPGAERTICDERFWKYRFAVGRDPKAAVGFPVVSVTAPDEAAGYGKTDRAKLGRRVEGLLAERPEAVEEYAFEEPAGPAKNTRPDRIVGRVLYRGHEYQTTTPLKSAGVPVREVAYTPPAALLQNDRAVYCVVADPKAVSGGLTVLIDLTFSMNRDLKNPDDKNPAPRERAKLTAAMDALEEVLRGLPPDTQVTFAVFWGDENGNPTVKPVDGLAAPMRWIGGGDAKQRDEVMRVLRALPANGDTTPLAQSIQAVVRTDEKPFWPAPEAASGVRTLLVLTDGAEVSKLTEKGYAGPGPGRVVLDALLTAREEVSLHVLFFGVPTGERQLASEQFKVVESRTEFDRPGRPPRRPGVLYRDLTDKAELVGKMKEAMRPRVVYWKPDPDVRPVPSELEVTIPDEGRYRASPYLAAGEYELRGLQTPQALRLDPGDRVILKARQRGVRFDLFTPPAAYDAADGRWPRAAGTRVRMTVPQVKTANPAGAYDLAAVVTLESADDQPDKTLAQPRPDFTWFDVTGPGGEPLKTPIRVRNRAGLVAPAWDVELPRWCPSSVAQANIPRPVVSGYWLKSQPGAQNVTVNPTSPVREYKPVTPGGGKVDVVWIDVEKGDGSDGLPPAADFLTVRLEYPEDPARPDPVFVRPGRLKETAKLQQLTERHRYYDLGPGVRRYTAWFGPVAARDREQPLELEVYRVSDLKKQAQAGGWDVTLRYPDAARLHADEPSPDLFLYPGK